MTLSEEFEKETGKESELQDLNYITWGYSQDYVEWLEAKINYTRCCTELNPEFAIDEQVLLTKNTVVTIETFCEDGMIEVDDNNKYYKVDKEELTKRV